MFEVTCPKCQTTLTVTDLTSGAILPCVACGQKLRVLVEEPSSEELMVSVLQSDVPSATCAPWLLPPRSLAASVLLGVCGLGGLGVAGAILLGWVLFDAGRNGPNRSPRMEKTASAGKNPEPGGGGKAPPPPGTGEGGISRKSGQTYDPQREPRQPALGLELNSTDLVLQAGENAKLTVRVRRQDCRGSVSLELNGLPRNVRTVPSALTVPEDQETLEFELTVPEDANNAKATVRVEAKLGELSADEQLTVQVKQQTFRVETQPRVKLRIGQTCSVPIALDRRGGYRGPVRLALTNLPDGVVADSAAVPANLSEAEIKVTASPRAIPSLSILKLQAIARDRQIEHQVSVAFRILEPAGEERRFQGHEGAVMCLAFAATGSRFVSGGADGKVVLWNKEAGRPVWSVLAAPDFKVHCVALSSDGRYVASGGSDTEVHVWDAETGREKEVFKDHRWPVWQVRFIAEGKRLQSTSEDRVCDRDVTTRLAKSLMQKVQVSQLHIPGPDGPRSLTGLGTTVLRLWDRSSSALPADFPHRSPIRGAAIGSDRRWVFSCGDDGFAHVWDVGNSRQPLYSFSGHKGPVLAVAGDPAASQHALSGGADGVIRYWRFPTTPEVEE